MDKRKILLLFLLLTVFYGTRAQRFYQPLAQFYDWEMQSAALTDSVERFTLFKPVLIPENDIDTVCKQKFTDWLYTHFFEDDFLKFASKDFSLTVNPVLDMEIFSQDNAKEDKDYFLNTRGFEIFGRLGKRIHFKTEFFENQARFLPFTDSIIKKVKKSIVPAQGHAKAFEVDGLDWAVSTASLTVDVCKNYRVSLGSDRHFIGSGYRSVILSHLTFPYPYLRHEVNYKKFYYNLLLAYLYGGRYWYVDSKKQGFKYSSFHVLGYKPLKNLELAFILGTMRQKSDKKNSVGYDINFSPLKNLKLYHQANYQGKATEKDGSETTLFSYQAGFHVFDLLFGLVPKLNSHFQAEYTVSRLDKNQTEADFWSYNYPMTTPFFMDQNNGGEFVCFLNLEYYGAGFDVKFLDRNSSRYRDITLKYFLNKKTKWNLFVSFSRHETSKEYYGADRKDNYITAGLAITPMNYYYDF
ncbi:MAG: hypothetical protein IKO99_11970 [Bacteroidales bacterium]|nr:hypothetical protein [Bacteroidales bacterium]